MLNIISVVILLFMLVMRLVCMQQVHFSCIFCEHNVQAIEHSKMANSDCEGHSKTFKEFLQARLSIRSLQIMLNKFKVEF